MILFIVIECNITEDDSVLSRHMYLLLFLCILLYILGCFVHVCVGSTGIYYLIKSNSLILTVHDCPHVCVCVCCVHACVHVCVYTCMCACVRVCV